MAPACREFGSPFFPFQGGLSSGSGLRGAPKSRFGDLGAPGISHVLVGHSFGGTYMELFAKAYPAEVGAVVLVDPRPKDFLEACEQQGLDMCGMDDDTLARQPETDQAEYTAFAQASEQITGEFGRYPVRVLTATEHTGASDAWNALWRSMQGDLADEAEDGEQIVVDGPHYLQVSRRQDVTEVIRSVLP